MRKSPSLDRVVETGDEKMAAFQELVFNSTSILCAEVGHAHYPVTLECDGKIEHVHDGPLHNGRLHTSHVKVMDSTQN